MIFSMTLQKYKVEKQLYEHPTMMKAVLIGKRGWFFVDGFVGWVRDDRNRRRADWYLERVINKLLPSFAQIEILHHFREKAGLTITCACWDRTNCRCWERFLLHQVMRYFNYHLNLIREPLPKFLRAWFMSEYSIQDYSDDNLKVIEKLEEYGLNDIEREDPRREAEAGSRELAKGMDLG